MFSLFTVELLETFCTLFDTELLLFEIEFLDALLFVWFFVELFVSFCVSFEVVLLLLLLLLLLFPPIDVPIPIFVDISEILTGSSSVEFAADIETSCIAAFVADVFSFTLKVNVAISLSVVIASALSISNFLFSSL